MNTKREKVRMMLGQWGSWTVLLDRLRREQKAARAWAEAEGGDAPRELLSKIDSEIDNLIRLRNSLSGLVQALPAQEQQILILRYEQNLSWVQIGIRLNYDERSVRRQETRAVDQIAGGLSPTCPPPVA